ncbi:MAG TPA: hypothetical protein DIV39_08130, partial [Verrucomicrobiales bacterium]|nr:hypothetical protein [Verrucomicrobiales bacterium]
KNTRGERRWKEDIAFRRHSQGNHFGHGRGFGDGTIFPVPTPLGLEEVTDLTGVFPREATLNRILDSKGWCPFFDHCEPCQRLTNHEMPFNYNYGS